ncbi:MAG: VanW family protein [bacterium]
MTPRPTPAPLWPKLLAGVAIAAAGGVLLVSPVAAQSGKEWPLPAGSAIAGVSVGGQVPSAAVATIAQSWDNYAEDPWGLNAGEITLQVTPAVLGLKPDLVRLADALEAGNRPPRTPLDHLRHWVTTPPPVVLPLTVKVNHATYMAWVKTVQPQVSIVAQNAHIDWASRSIVAEVSGQGFDSEKWEAIFQQPVEHLEARQLDLPVSTVTPTVVAADLGHVDLNTIFATYTTEFDVHKVSRTHNIATAVAKWQGVTVGPHEQISFNQTVGQRNATNGFLKAPVYENRRVSEGFGGGICQVSTTLYNTALVAGFDVLQRTGHSRPCTYAPPGRDATVDWPSRDLVIRNPYDFPVLIQAVVEGDSVTFTFFGDPAHIPVITLEEAVTNTGGPGAPQMILDESLPIGTQKYEDRGFAGRKVAVTRIWNAGTPEERRESMGTDRLASLSPIIRYHPAADSILPTEEIAPAEPTGDSDPPPTPF